MTNLKDYVNWKLTHADKTTEAEGYPLTMQNCKANKRMKQLEIYGNSFQDGTPTPDAPIEVQSVGELVTDVNDASYGKYKIPLVQRGVNLFSMAKAGLTAKTVNGITFTPLDDERIHIKGKIADSSSNAVYNPDFKVKVPIEKGVYNVKPYSGIYTILFRADKDKNDTFLDNINATNTNNNIAEDAYLTRIHIQINATSTKEWDDIVPIQLTKGTGTKKLAYEPYVEPTSTNIFLNEPLHKIGDYTDYVDFKNKCVVRRNKEIVLKGADIVYRYTSYGNKYGYYVYGTGGNYKDVYLGGFYSFSIRKQPEKSTHFIANTAQSSDIMQADDWHIRDNYALRFLLAPEAYASDGVSSTLADIQTWVQAQYDAGTPLKFIYRLVQPIEESIACELPKLNAKTTIIEVDSSVAPSDAYGKYIKR